MAELRTYFSFYAGKDWSRFKVYVLGDGLLIARLGEESATIIMMAINGMIAGFLSPFLFHYFDKYNQAYVIIT